MEQPFIDQETRKADKQTVTIKDNIKTSQIK